MRIHEQEQKNLGVGAIEFSVAGRVGLTSHQHAADARTCEPRSSPARGGQGIRLASSCGRRGRGGANTVREDGVGRGLPGAELRGADGYGDDGLRRVLFFITLEPRVE